MCVDDYPFRDPSALREKICRRFIFENDEGYRRVFNINISQFERNGDLCLCQIFMHLNKKGLSINDYYFEIPELNIVVEAGDKCLIDFEVLKYKQVLVFAHKIEENHEYDGNLPANLFQEELSQGEKIQHSYSEEIDEESSQQREENNSNEMEAEGQKMVEKSTNQLRPKKKKKISKTGKTKQPERTIEQAIFRTKHWRYLHERVNLSLKNAAEVVGISKKTLDDFFLVIRVGEVHGYNFQENLTKKIGHLRAFIKSQKQKIKGRLSKYVDCFKYVKEPDIQNIVPIKNWERLNEISEES